MSLFKFFLFFILLSSLVTGFPEHRILFGEVNRDNRIQLGAYVTSHFSQYLKNSNIYNYCIGSFVVPGNDEYLMILKNKKSLDARFAIIYEKKHKPILINLESFLFDLSNPPEIQCLSYMETLRLKQTLKENIGANSSLRLVSQNDIACVTNPKLDYDFSCYAYDFHLKKVIPIGGWSN